MSLGRRVVRRSITRQVATAADNVGCAPPQIPLSKPLGTKRLQAVSSGTRFEPLGAAVTRGSRAACRYSAPEERRVQEDRGSVRFGRDSAESPNLGLSKSQKGARSVERALDVTTCSRAARVDNGRQCLDRLGELGLVEATEAQHQSLFPRAAGIAR
jgi:hypothetical protein